MGRVRERINHKRLLVTSLMGNRMLIIMIIMKNCIWKQHGRQHSNTDSNTVAAGIPIDYGNRIKNSHY
jgi:hypothetical protein